MKASDRLKLLLAQKKLAAGLANSTEKVDVKIVNLGGPGVIGILSAASVQAIEKITKEENRLVGHGGKLLDADPYQDRAVELARVGHSFVMTGPAGSGKSTTLKRMVEAVIESGHAGQLQGGDHKYLPMSGTPGIVVTSFTNKAISNDKRFLSSDMWGNCLTHHKLLEFEPVYDKGIRDGESYSTMSFEPKRDASNILPSSIRVLIIEESTLTNVPLWNLLIAALPTRAPQDLQVIIVGDIQQLPPVFGKSIFIHAMQRGMEVVELKNVYRQALESPILALAHRILSGKMIPAPKIKEFSVDAGDKGQVVINPWKHKLTDTGAIVQMMQWLPIQIDKGNLNPEEDMVLTPYNKSFGTIVLNEIIAGHYAKKLGAEVYEIFTGVKKKYFRVGERVLYNKQEARITSIVPNSAYFGKSPRLPSPTMDYAGVEYDRSKYAPDTISDEKFALESQSALDAVDAMFEAMSNHTDDESPTARAASHKVTVQLKDTGITVELSTAGEVTPLDLGYALTVHKSQGSEYDNVFFITHSSQANMLFRELIYTAVTRAKKRLVVICESNMFVAGINSQRLPGETIEQKIKSFDKWLSTNKMAGQGNIDEIPAGLHRFITANKDRQEEVAA